MWIPECQFERDHTTERYTNDPSALPPDSIQKAGRVVRKIGHERGLVGL
jgi:hypothetical protein